MIQIDRGIPIPPPPTKGRPKGASGQHKYPWRKMEVGDSFVWPKDKLQAHRAIWWRRHYDGNTYEVRTLGSACFGSEYVRIWRTA